MGVGAGVGVVLTLVLVLVFGYAGGDAVVAIVGGVSVRDNGAGCVG